MACYCCKETKKSVFFEVLVLKQCKLLKNIDKKITQEQTRLALWETRQKKYFANLETLLNNYKSMQTQLESQISKLNSSSSSSSSS